MGGFTVVSVRLLTFLGLVVFRGSLFLGVPKEEDQPDNHQTKKNILEDDDEVETSTHRVDEFVECLRLREEDEDEHEGKQ